MSDERVPWSGHKIPEQVDWFRFRTAHRSSQSTTWTREPSQCTLMPSRNYFGGILGGRMYVANREQEFRCKLTPREVTESFRDFGWAYLLLSLHGEKFLFPRSGEFVNHFSWFWSKVLYRKSYSSFFKIFFDTWKSSMTDIKNVSPCTKTTLRL